MSRNRVAWAPPVRRRPGRAWARPRSRKRRSPRLRPRQLGRLAARHQPRIQGRQSTRLPPRQLRQLVTRCRPRTQGRLSHRPQTQLSFQRRARRLGQRGVRHAPRTRVPLSRRLWLIPRHPPRARVRARPGRLPRLQFPLGRQRRSRLLRPLPLRRHRLPRQLQVRRRLKAPGRLLRRWRGQRRRPRLPRHKSLPPGSEYPPYPRQRPDKPPSQR
jgi:hypothetical protein